MVVALVDSDVTTGEDAFQTVIVVTVTTTVVTCQTNDLKTVVRMPLAVQDTRGTLDPPKDLVHTHIVHDHAPLVTIIVFFIPLSVEKED